ncbi:phosphotransferase [Candidatus Shapirobacteria bacterium]|nr:phosphotransferase [Candidatus Shapirobacteria bacterium]
MHAETAQDGTYEAGKVAKHGNYRDCFYNNFSILEEFARNYGFNEAVCFIEDAKESLISLVEKRASFAGGRFSLIHFDVSGGNVILSKREPVLIDWGSAHINDPAWDLARAFMKLATEPKVSLLTFFEHYGLDSDVLDRVIIYLPLAFLSAAIGRFHDKDYLTERASLKSLSAEDLLQLSNFCYQRLIKR